MKRHFVLGLFLLCAALNTGCLDTSVSDPFSDYDIENDALAIFNSGDKKYDESASGEPEQTEYSLLYESGNYVCSKYETDGCYVGASIQNDELVSSFSEFEAITASQAFYAVTITLGEEYPEEKVLSCFAAGKSPLFTVIPPAEGDIYDAEALNEFAVEAGKYNFPVFIELYPYSAKEKFSAKGYKEFFRRAKAIFDEKAQNVALIWSCSLDDAAAAKAYYCGDEFNDWVGVRIYRDLNASGEEAVKAIADSLQKNLDYFYFSYQKTKPIFITRLGISHYSTKNNLYFTKSTAEETKAFYKSFSEKYTRIKAVCYDDTNELNFKSGKDYILNNYSLTDEPDMLEAYTAAISGSRFLDDVVAENTGRSITERFTSPFAAYGSGDEIYVSEKSLIYDLGLVGVNNVPGRMIIGGEPYYPAGELKKRLSYDFYADSDSKSLVVKK